MGKGSKPKRQKHKARLHPMPRLAAIKSSKQARDNMGRYVQEVTEPSREALEARCRHLGVRPTKEALNAVTAQHGGSDMGRVMIYQVAAGEMPRNRVAALWDVWQAYSSVHETYGRLVLGQRPFPKGAAVEMVREQVETDTSYRVDLRDEETRIADAKSSRARWDGYVARLSGADGSALAFLRIGGGPAMWDGKRPTDYGLHTLRALDRLAREVARG